MNPLASCLDRLMLAEFLVRLHLPSAEMWWISPAEMESPILLQSSTILILSLQKSYCCAFVHRHLTKCIPWLLIAWGSNWRMTNVLTSECLLPKCNSRRNSKILPGMCNAPPGLQAFMSAITCAWDCMSMSTTTCHVPRRHAWQTPSCQMTLVPPCAFGRFSGCAAISSSRLWKMRILFSTLARTKCPKKCHAQNPISKSSRRERMVTDSWLEGFKYFVSHVLQASVQILKSNEPNVLHVLFYKNGVEETVPVTQKWNGSEPSLHFALQFYLWKQSLHSHRKTTCTPLAA